MVLCVSCPSTAVGPSPRSQGDCHRCMPQGRQMAMQPDLAEGLLHQGWKHLETHGKSCHDLMAFDRWQPHGLVRFSAHHESLWRSFDDLWCFFFFVAFIYYAWFYFVGGVVNQGFALVTWKRRQSIPQLMPFVRSQLQTWNRAIMPLSAAAPGFGPCTWLLRCQGGYGSAGERDRNTCVFLV